MTPLDWAIYFAIVGVLVGLFIWSLVVRHQEKKNPNQLEEL